MKVLVTGVGGQLGFDVVRELVKRGHKAIGCDIINCNSLGDTIEYINLDITDKPSVDMVMNAIHADAVIHCAAWTSVDAAEEDKNQESVYSINVLGTSYIAEACKKNKCKMLYISTDYVFDGKGDKPWLPDSTEYAPINRYGKSKLQGEIIVSNLLEKFFIVRISWLFGKNGNNFVNSIINLGKENSTLKVVCDQIGTPTYSVDLARLLVDMIETEKYGYYHASNEGEYISWYKFACEVFKQTQISSTVQSVTTDEYGLNIAKRPLNSRLDKKKLIENGFELLPDWQDALKRYLQEIGY